MLIWLSRIVRGGIRKKQKVPERESCLYMKKIEPDSERLNKRSSGWTLSPNLPGIKICHTVHIASWWTVYKMSLQRGKAVEER